MAKTGGMLFITGIKELDAKLKRMSFRMQGRIIRESMKEAMQPVLEQARNTIPVDTGYTKKRLRVKTGKPRRDGSRIVRVGIFGPAAHGRGKGSRQVATGRIIEFGSKGTEAKFILRKSLSSRDQAVRSILISRLRAGVRSAVL